MVRWLSITACVLVADRVTKWFVADVMALGDRIAVLPIFSWTHLQNPGAAFSMFADAGGWQRWFFVLLAIGFSAYLLYELRRIVVPANVVERLAAWGYALIMGGALGNMWDRATHGYVVDFALVHWRDYYFPAFNVADSAITIGASLWILSMVLEARAKKVA